MNGESSDAPRPGSTANFYVTNPWLPMTVILVGTLMVLLDTTIVNVALPAIAEDLDASRGIEWVVIAYLVTVCVSQPAAGWLADRFGRKRVYQVGLVAFTAASLAAALAPNLGILVACRALQGIGGGALGPVGMTVVFDLFPREQHGKAIGVWGLAAMAAPAIGPTLGGWLVDTVSWHWLFLINLPMGIIATVLGIKLLPEMPLRPSRRFDVIGFFTGGAGVALTVLGLSEGNSWGWGTAKTIGVLGIGVATLVMFVYHELHTESPLIELRMFSHPVFALTFIVSFMVTASQYARLVFIPLALEGLRGYSATRVGLLLGPAAIGTAIGMTSGGRISDRIGSRIPIMVGVAIMIPPVLLLSQLHLDSSLFYIGSLLTLQGFGMGLTAAPTVVAAMGTLPSAMIAQGSAMRSVFQQLSGAMAVAGFTTVYDLRAGDNPSPEDAQHAYNMIFFVSALTLVAALAFGSLLPKGRRHMLDESGTSESHVSAASLTE
ncbi:MAG: DHA2 family efflux MFS transporter permease subunit [Acidimicrobiia bacterium]